MFQFGQVLLYVGKRCFVVNGFDISEVVKFFCFDRFWNFFFGVVVVVIQREVVVVFFNEFGFDDFYYWDMLNDMFRDVCIVL